MKTPIYDFIKKYAQSNSLRMHMPGHKGIGDIEKYDITEISGADSLYEASGIIKESENNASLLFGADTFYSAEGSSLSIRAMLYLVNLFAKSNGRNAKVLAARNAHKTFITAVSLLDIDVEWITPEENESYLSSSLTYEKIEEHFKKSSPLPDAVYLTSPDYLGKIADIKAISDVCHKYGVLLLVDNAHGAYLKFLKESMHPIDLGADMCCDSAHKTLPCLTGAAYLHISKSAPVIFKENAKDALALFGSTSPSYLILSSLDKANEYINGGYKEKLSAFVSSLDGLKNRLIESGYTLFGNEPMKLTVYAKPYGYLGTELAEKLAKRGITVEFSDPDFVVLMPTPEISESELAMLEEAFLAIEKRSPISSTAPKNALPERAMSPREALLAMSETIPVEKALGRTLAAVTVGCPPAVPIIVSGEVIDEKAIEAFLYYGIKEFKVVK